jgi:serine/threonine-protein kinase RsbW
MVRTVSHATVARLAPSERRVQHGNVMGRTAEPHSDAVVDLPNSGERPSAVELSLPARGENVAVVRHVVAAFAESLCLDAGLVGDLRLAVTEACTNVVRHAYTQGEQGTIELAITPTPDALRIVVGDCGRGIGSSPDTRGPGLGLALIAAIADSLEIEQDPETGSRVAMSFARRRHEAAA